MTNHRFARPSFRATRGGAVAQALIVILGASLALFGGLMALSSAAFMIDGDGSYFPFLIFALLICAGGTLLVIGQLKAGDTGSAASTQPVSSIPMAIDTTGPAAEAPEDGAPAASEQTAPQDVAQDEPAGLNPTEDVAHLVFRSTDLFATLRDLVRHERSSDSDKRRLATMLEAAGVMDWPDAPACEGGRLTRNTHFWIRLNPEELTDDQYDTLIAAEAALGANQDLPELRRMPLDDPACLEASLTTMRELSGQRIERPRLTDDGLRFAYGAADAAATSDEWLVRSLICNAAESVKAPFRVIFDLRVNLDEGLVALEIELPRPRCMAIFTPVSKDQAGLARAYALRLATFLARQALQASDAIETVIVNGHERGHEEVLLSVRFDRKKLALLERVVEGDAVEAGFPTDEDIRAQFAGDWFAPCEPFVSIDDQRLVPEAARTLPELDEREASEAVQRTCHVKRISELGINESAARVAAWNEIVPKLGDTTAQAVATLVEARGAAQDITVAEACTRTITALVEGTGDLEDRGDLARLFINGSSLDTAVDRAASLLSGPEGSTDPKGALDLLNKALAPIDDVGAYLDDDTSVYRYFGSVSERIHYNAVADDGERIVRLVPDAYFNAHSNASIAHGLLGDFDQALAHADICLRLAPLSTYATMRKVRVLEGQSRIYEAVDLIIEALRHAVTPRDAAICHYRLAYMEWKLGREDLACACYQRSLTWDTEMSQQAREELADLLDANPGLERPTDEQADALLAREGIPLGCIRTDAEQTFAAAVACMDDRALMSARPLMATFFGLNGDDVVMGVYRSLSVSV